MDTGTAAGLLLAFGALAISVVLEGGNPWALVSIPAALIVFGGTLGAALVSCPLRDFVRLPHLLRLAFFPHVLDHPGTAREILRLATITRRKGLLQLEAEMETLRDPFLIKGLTLVIDGTDPETVRETLRTEISTMNARHQAGARVFQIMGALAPTLGVTGTVMGLTQMLARVSDPSTMGPAIATAFLATLYGVASANLVFLPIASKLVARSDEEAHLCALLLEGLAGLQAGLSPMVIEERLKSFLDPTARNWSRESAAVHDDDDSKPEAA